MIGHTVKITDEKLSRLRMLMDWQLREEGFDPDSVTQACQQAEDSACRCRSVCRFWNGQKLYHNVDSCPVHSAESEEYGGRAVR
jgi:hypothetical protein